MWDDFIDSCRAIKFLIITLATGLLIMIPGLLFISNGTDKLQTAVAEIEVVNAVQASEIPSSDYTAQVIKDVEGNVVGVMFEGNGSVSIMEQKPEVKSSYVDNSTTIINESESHFYKAVIVVAVLAFVAFVVYYVLENKKREAERTERILSTPLESFGNTEVKELKDKYKEKDDGRFTEFDSL